MTGVDPADPSRRPVQGRSWHRKPERDLVHPRHRRPPRAGWPVRQSVLPHRVAGQAPAPDRAQAAVGSPGREETPRRSGCSMRWCTRGQAFLRGGAGPGASARTAAAQRLRAATGPHRTRARRVQGRVLSGATEPCGSRRRVRSGVGRGVPGASAWPTRQRWGAGPQTGPHPSGQGAGGTEQRRRGPRVPARGGHPSPHVAGAGWPGAGATGAVPPSAAP